MRRIWTDKIRTFLILSSLSLLISCQLDFPEIDRVQNLGTQKVGIYAGGTATRTEMLSNGLSAAWTAGDELAVWARTSTGSYALSNQVFTTYGIDSQRGFFTSTLPSAMADGTYTYMCCYPVPTSISGTNATFDLPALQDGKVSGGADIMIATPVEHGPLTSIPDPDDHSGMSLRMNRLMHQFRFWLPSEYGTIGEDIEQIVISMPQNIAGTVTADISAPSSAAVLSNGTNTMTLELAEPISASADFDNASFACAAVFPYNGTYTSSDYMNLTAYTQKYKATIDPISLSGRTFAAGHSTPVQIKPVSIEEYYRLTMIVRDNHIGEPLSNVRISFNGGEWYRYTNTSAEGNGNFRHSVEAFGADGKEAYDLIISSITSGVATYTYETEHALVERPITADMMTYDGNRIVLDLGDVPYLLDEDFSGALATAHDDDYSSSSDTNLGGYVLNGYMPLDGWNASRFSIIEGEYVRINCRYEAAVLTYAKYCGRLDTPALKYLKSDASVNVRVEYNYAFQVPAGLNMADANEAVSMYYVGTHTRSESSSIKGVKGNSVADAESNMHSFGPYTAGSLAEMASQSIDFTSVGASTRIAFFVSTTRGQSDVNFLGNNSNYYLYLDNIKVYINN